MIIGRKHLKAHLVIKLKLMKFNHTGNFKNTSSFLVMTPTSFNITERKPITMTIPLNSKMKETVNMTTQPITKTEKTLDIKITMTNTMAKTKTPKTPPMVKTRAETMATTTAKTLANTMATTMTKPNKTIASTPITMTGQVITTTQYPSTKITGLENGTKMHTSSLPMTNRSQQKTTTNKPTTLSTTTPHNQSNNDVFNELENKAR